VAGSSKSVHWDNRLADPRRCRQPTRNALRADQGGFQSAFRADAQLNTLLFIAHGSCNYECKEWQALRDGSAIGSEMALSVRMHSCMHCGRAQSDTMVAAVHRMCCSVPPWRRTLPSSRIRILVRV
jgi:hypothetical protein